MAWVSYRNFCGVSDVDVRCPIRAGPHKHKKPYTISKGRKVSTFNQFHTRSHSLLYSSSVPVVAENRAVSRCNMVSPISTWPRWVAVEIIMGNYGCHAPMLYLSCHCNPIWYSNSFQLSAQNGSTKYRIVSTTVIALFTGGLASIPTPSMSCSVGCAYSSQHRQYSSPSSAVSSP